MNEVTLIIDDELTLYNIERELDIPYLDGIVLDIFYDMLLTEELFIISCEIEDIIQENKELELSRKVEDIIFQSLDLENIQERLFRDWRNNGKKEDMLIRPDFSKYFYFEKDGKFRKTNILSYGNELVLKGWNRKFSSSIDELVFVGD